MQNPQTSVVINHPHCQKLNAEVQSLRQELYEHKQKEDHLHQQFQELGQIKAREQQQYLVLQQQMESAFRDREERDNQRILDLQRQFSTLQRERDELASRLSSSSNEMSPQTMMTTINEQAEIIKKQQEELGKLRMTEGQTQAQISSQEKQVS